MKISLLLTGNELMSGDTVDTNSNYFAQSLKDLSLVPYVKKVVGDDLDLLASSIRELAKISDVLIINGGLGPTADDLTAQALARVAKVPLVRHPLALAELEEWAVRRGFVLTESNLKQADLPENCEVIANPYGSAVGFSLEINKCLVMCSPGVPSEFKPMVEAELLPRLREVGEISKTSTITRLRLFGITESGLQDMINADFPDWPSEVEVGFRVQMPVIEVKIMTVGKALDDLNKRCTQRFEARFSDYVIGRDSMRLAQALNNALQNSGQKIAIAESCTGGGVAAAITSEAGSSAVFEAGFVVYSDRIKHKILGVREETLTNHGAVSEQTVRELVAGALRITSSELALAISGVAGPTGGTKEKPVGTVWIAWGDKKTVKARKFFWPVSRHQFQRTATAIAMDLIRREVLGLPTDVDYFSELKRKQ